MIDLIKEDKLSIGQMAKLNHTSPSTLRFYEKLGLLQPAYINPETGYRYYDVTQSVVVRAIQYSTNLDISMKELLEIAEVRDIRMLESLYQKKITEVEAAIEQLTQKEHTLHKAVQYLEHYRNLPPAGTFTLEYLPTEYVYARPARKNYFQEDFRTYVYAILDIAEQLEQDQIVSRYQYFTGFTLSLENYLKGDFRAHMEGVYVDAAYAGHPHVKKEEGQLCACLYIRGFSQLSEALLALQNGCRQHNCRESGAVICRLMGTLSQADFRKPCPLLRLQVPVSMETKPALFEREG